MASKPHVQRFVSDGYNPWEVRQDERTRCSVCGWAGIDPINTQEPEQQAFSTVVTGTQYVIPVGTPADRLASGMALSAANPGDPSGAPFIREDGLPFFFASPGDPSGDPLVTADGNTSAAFSEPGDPLQSPAKTHSVDKDVFTQEGARSGCAFCGSPNWSFGSAPDLHW